MWEHDRMGLPPELLGAGEVEVLSLRTHVKALFIPAVVLVLVAVAIGVSFALPSDVQPWANWVVLAVGVLALIFWVLVPFLRWATTTYTFTNRRIITRRGIITQSGHDLPLSRIVNVAYSRDLLDRNHRRRRPRVVERDDRPLLVHGPVEPPHLDVPARHQRRHRGPGRRILHRPRLQHVDRFHVPGT